MISCREWIIDTSARVHQTINSFFAEKKMTLKVTIEIHYAKSQFPKHWRYSEKIKKNGDSSFSMISRNSKSFLPSFIQILLPKNKQKSIENMSIQISIKTYQNHIFPTTQKNGEPSFTHPGPEDRPDFTTSSPLRMSMEGVSLLNLKKK